MVLALFGEFFFGEQWIDLGDEDVVTAKNKDHGPLQTCGGHEVCHADAVHWSGIITHRGGCVRGEARVEVMNDRLHGECASSHKDEDVTGWHVCFLQRLQIGSQKPELILPGPSRLHDGWRARLQCLQPLRCGEIQRLIVLR